MHPLTVAIVGSGPSGFYAAKALLNAGPNIQINMIERLPVPFGLVRYGVAPDHPKLKMVSAVFQRIAENPRVRFFGNVSLGRDISLKDLKATHHAVILCHGAGSERKLGIPGENLQGSYSAAAFVAWYNGHPDYTQTEFDLSKEVAVIIGQGNVAADIARILMKPVDDLKSTDIATHALEQLAKSRVREVHIIGRRGPVQAKFASKELRELGALNGCSTTCAEEGFQLGPSDVSELAEKTGNNAVKCFDLFKTFGQVPNSTNNRHIRFHFLLSPIEMLGDSHLESIRFLRNRLSGEAMSQFALSTEARIDIPCGICFKSIGYRGIPIADAPFDETRGIIPNNEGRVIDANGVLLPGIYVSGWIKRGPFGFIGTNKADSFETVETLIRDLPHLSEFTDTGNEGLVTLLKARKVAFVDFDKWRMIDNAELQKGQQLGKSREKITSIAQMLAIAG